MRFNIAAAVTCISFAALAKADYFSAGWSPGQKVETAAEPVATFNPESTATAPPPQATPFTVGSLLSIEGLLTSGPIVALFQNFGINITERVQLASDKRIWDERIQLITDDNFDDLIVNEPLTEQEEKDRVWVIAITVTATGQEGISKYVDQIFDSAFNKSQAAGDLPNVKWGRIDYLNVTYITTKWNVWQAPYIVVLTDRGQTLRFYRHYQIRLRDDALLEFLRTEGWKQTAPWSSLFAPGGEREWIMDIFAKYLTKAYNITILIPRWILFILSGSAASLIIAVLHRSPKKKAPTPGNTKVVPKPVAQPPSQAAKLAPTSAAASSAPSTRSKSKAPATDSEREGSAPPGTRSSARQRKNKK
ncbi:hypothetical protein CVT24_005788 [Panaeolus cyanescens]|uniref:Thioredoxin-like fold domain-containing protein n=1 Tax=Panaeolus cyanescens TaxID=181874 RepID=A0A409V935_9AGAR|nr:hypothetical protein CVT24_005788 [Panaeolus cyanescens]